MSRYSFRVDVAKPAAVYQPSFETVRTPGCASGLDGVPTPKAIKTSSPSARSAGLRAECVLGKRRNRTSGRTEVLVQWVGRESTTWVPSSTVNALLVREFEAKRQRRELLQGDADDARSARGAPVRILAQRASGGDDDDDTDDERDGPTEYLVQFSGCRLSEAEWVAAEDVDDPELLAQFDQAVARVRDLSQAKLLRLQSGSITLQALVYLAWQSIAQGRIVALPLCHAMPRCRRSALRRSRAQTPCPSKAARRARLTARCASRGRRYSIASQSRAQHSRAEQSTAQNSRAQHCIA